MPSPDIIFWMARRTDSSGDAMTTITLEREAALLASVPTGLLINGEWRDASDGGTFDVHDPATGLVQGRDLFLHRPVAEQAPVVEPQPRRLAVDLAAVGYEATR